MSKKRELPELIGTVDKARIEAAIPEWAASSAEAAPDLEAAKALADVPPGADVTVFLGTWCSDSMREVPRLWKALESLGSDDRADGLPFDVRYIGVDRDKKQPVGNTYGEDLRYVPTIIVRRGPLEVGRIVEEPLTSIEMDLAMLLNGEASGILTSSRPELLEEEAEPAGDSSPAGDGR